MGVKSPKPLAIWTDGADGTDEHKCVEYFALMMEDMTADGTMEVHDISGLDVSEPVLSPTASVNLTNCFVDSRHA